jgi:hypothetical protein
MAPADAALALAPVMCVVGEEAAADLVVHDFVKLFM